MAVNICNIVYTCLKEIHSTQVILNPVFTETLRRYINENYKKEISREELEKCLRKLESTNWVKCNYDQDGTLYSSYIIWLLI